MKFIIALTFLTICLIDSNATNIQKRGVIDDWPSISHRWTEIGEDFKRRADLMRRRMGISNFSPIHGLTENFDEKPQEFDPSVVVVDKGQEVETPHTFIDFGLDFPFQSSFDRPKQWPFGHFFSTYKPWWKGPNVCVERRVIEGQDNRNNTKNTKNNDLEVEEDSVSVRMNFQSNGPSIHHSISLQSTQCTESDTSYTCVSKIIRGKENKTTIVKHQCCHGFKRNANSECTQVDLKDLVQTMKDLKSNRMLRLIERLGLNEKLIRDNITVFSLTDDSLIEYEDDHNKDENEVEPEVFAMPLRPVQRRRRELENSMSEMISMHLISGFVKTGDFDDELQLSSLSPSKRLIRINIYNNPKRIITANCAPIISANNYATNGIVHIIDRAMQMPNKSIAEIIDSDSRFTTLKNLLANTDLMDKLRDNSRHMTLFAPTNDAFSRLDKLYLEGLLKGQSCVESLLNHHIMTNTLCSSAIQSFASVKNGINELLTIKRVDEKLEINGIRVLETDILGTNGVVHVIDGVIISERSQPISKYLERHRMTEYLNLIKESGLLNEWDALKNVSFFIPSLNYMQTLSAKRLEDIKNKTKEMIAYHVVRPQSDSCDWNSDQVLETMTGNQLRVNIFGDIPGFGFRPVTTAQCAKIVEDNEEICGANIHVIDRFLSAPTGNLTQVLDSTEKFSIIRRIIKNSGIEMELENGVHTLLAPNDRTLRQHLSQQQINSLVTTQSESEKFIKNHLLPEIICCSGVNSSPLLLSTQQIRNLEGSLVSAHRSINGRVRFGNARVTQCDLMAHNGVIHEINKVLESKPSIISNFPFPFEIIF